MWDDMKYGVYGKTNTQNYYNHETIFKFTLFTPAIS